MKEVTLTQAKANYDVMFGNNQRQLERAKIDASEKAIHDGPIRASGESLGRFSLDLPETSLRTRALYFTIPEPVETAMRTAEGDFNRGIHAAEHAMIAMFPFELLCDRRDIGGLSTPLHPHTNQSTIFIYNGYPGGVGLTRAGYDDIETLLRRTREMIDNSSCVDGCPTCVQSPHCENANDPLDKGLAAMLLDRLLDST